MYSVSVYWPQYNTVQYQYCISVLAWYYTVSVYWPLGVNCMYQCIGHTQSARNLSYGSWGSNKRGQIVSPSFSKKQFLPTLPKKTSHRRFQDQISPKIAEKKTIYIGKLNVDNWSRFCGLCFKKRRSVYDQCKLGLSPDK